ncbi:MAG: M20/M25/M40 family metallo-hydrolase, partial [Pseudomonadales bacterium]|nr:M20/M25/M40 family metallo-hydrolase [Pseudomonadales bacterium]
GRVELLHPPVLPIESVGEYVLGTTRELSGADAQSVAFATEAPFLSQLGMETVVMGPGSINQAHQPNEFIELNQLEPTIGIIRALIRKYCLAGN